MFKNHIKIALRNFTKQKTYSIINVVGLSIAITCCLLVYLFVSSELNYDKFNAQHADIYRLNFKTKRGANSDWRELGASAPVMAPELVMNAPEVRKYARVKGGMALIKVNEEYKDEFFSYADPELFEIFDFSLVRGEAMSMKEDSYSVLLSEDYAKKWFNTLEVVGKAIEIELGDEFVSLTIKGVMKNIPSNSSVKFDLLLPFSQFERTAGGDWLTSWQAWGISTFLLMGNNYSQVDFVDRISEIAKGHFPEESRDNFALTLQPLLDIHLNENVRGMSRGGQISTSWTLIAIATFILIIASINFTNLSIGMVLPRIKEIGVRKVVGAHRFNLITQFLGETFFFVLLSFFLAVLLTDLLLPSFGELTNTSMNLWYQIDTSIVLYAIGLMIFITLLSGSYPAIVIARFNTIRSLNGQEKVGNGGLLTKLLIVIQFGLAVFFTLGVGVMIQQVDYFYTADKGYNDQEIATLWVKDIDGAHALEQMKNRLSSVYSIKSITAIGWSGYYMSYEGEDYNIGHSRIDTDYLSTMKISLLLGRDFNSELESDKTNSIIVNKAFLEAIGISIDNAIGEPIPFNLFEDMKNVEIIGVIDNVKFESLQRDVVPRILHINPAMAYKRILVKINEGELRKGVNEMKNVWEDVFPNRPFEPEYLEQINQQQYVKEANDKKVISAAGIISILISCLGLFALSSLHIRQRTKEVGVRKVLGANMSRLVIILSKDFTILVLVSVLIASPLAWYAANDWLSNFSHHIDLHIGWFMLTSIFILPLACLSIAYQTIFTAKSNPVDSLRDE